MEKTEDNKGIFSRIYDWFTNLTMKGLLGAILVALVIVIVLFSISFLPSIMGRISSSLSAALYSIFVPAQNATITADKSIINTGEDFTINFKNGDTSASGLFAVSYSCDTNTDLLSVETNGLKKITCDTPYYLLANDNSIKIRANTQNDIARLVITGSFENNDTQKTEDVGVVRITVKNSSAVKAVIPSTTNTAPVSTTANTGTPTQSTSVSAPVQSTYYGKADLVIRMLQIGLLNSGTNMISNQTQFSYSDMVGIKFEVRNDGDANTGPWSFTATLPSLSTPIYNSNTQISLKPGESIIFTLGFTNLTNIYSNNITINVDPQNLVAESNKSNNTITSAIINNGYNNNYNSDNGCYINGVYTYNCGSNNNYNNVGYYDNYGNFIRYNNNTTSYYSTNFGVTCYSDSSSVSRGDRVFWHATAFGGNGNYHYTWTGTDGLSGSAQNPSMIYNYSGQKEALVTVESNGFYISHTCSVNVY